MPQWKSTASLVNRSTTSATEAVKSIIAREYVFFQWHSTTFFLSTAGQFRIAKNKNIRTILDTDRELKCAEQLLYLKRFKTIPYKFSIVPFNTVWNTVIVSGSHRSGKTSAHAGLSS